MGMMNYIIYPTVTVFPILLLESHRKGVGLTAGFGGLFVLPQFAWQHEGPEVEAVETH